MLVQLAYGKIGYSVELPEEDVTILNPFDLPAIPDPYGATLEAIRNPLGDHSLRHLITSNDTLAIYLGDLDKQISTPFILSCLMRDLSHVPKNQIHIIFNYSELRADPYDRLYKMNMGDLFDGIQVFNHNPLDRLELVDAKGSYRDVPILLNKVWMGSSKKLTIGLVKPHPFIGFTGGYDLIVPGLAGIDTINHIYNDPIILNTDFLRQPTKDNPLQHFHSALSKSGRSDFNINFTTNNQGRMTSVFAGQLPETFIACKEITQRASLVDVGELFDLVLTSNGGAPYDLTLFETIPGILLASRLSKDNGSIICVADCPDGLSPFRNSSRLYSKDTVTGTLTPSHSSFNDMSEDAWRAMILAEVISKCTVYLKSNNLSTKIIKDSGLQPVGKSVERLISEVQVQKGKPPSICVLPQGSNTMINFCFNSETHTA